MATELSSDRVQQIIFEAANLLLKCADYIEDVNKSDSSTDHWDIFYAIDADILSLYLQPNLGKLYLDIFDRGEDNIATSSLGLLLGDFLFSDENQLINNNLNLTRFLIIPPHDSEIVSIIAAIYQALINTVFTSVNDKYIELTQIFEDYYTDQDDKKLLESLNNNVPGLVDLYNPFRGPKAALERYGSLKKNTIQRIDQFTENGYHFPIFDPFDDNQIESRNLFDGLVANWENNIKKLNKKKPKHLIKTDAKVLATLQYINSKTQFDHKKIVLITGSSSLFKTANEIKGSDSTHSFASDYLRHPLSFLAHPMFFSTDSEEKPNFNLINWLSLLFPNAIVSDNTKIIIKREFIFEGRKGNFDASKAIEALVQSGRDPEYFVDEWESQLLNMAKLKYSGGLEKAKQRGAKKLADILLLLKNTRQWTIDNLKQLLLNEAVTFVSDLYSKTVWIGLWTSIDRNQSKSIPALRFSNGIIEDYCIELVKTQLKSIRNGLTVEDLDNIQNIYIKIEQEEDSQYLIHLLHAYAFTVKGQWQPALILLDTALELLNQRPEESKDRYHGREAAYLACIVSRRIARTKDGLIEAQRYLSIATKIQSDFYKFEDIRFSSEEILLEIKKTYFDVFNDDLLDFSEKYSNLIQKTSLAIDSAKTETNNRVKNWILKELLMGYFTIILIVLTKIDPDWSNTDEFNNHIRENLQLFSSEIRRNDEYSLEMKDEPYAYLIEAVCGFIWSHEKSNFFEGEALRMLNSWEANYLPYDLKRIQLFKQCLQDGNKRF